MRRMGFGWDKSLGQKEPLQLGAGGGGGVASGQWAVGDSYRLRLGGNAHTTQRDVLCKSGRGEEGREVFGPRSSRSGKRSRRGDASVQRQHAPGCRISLHQEAAPPLPPPGTKTGGGELPWFSWGRQRPRNSILAPSPMGRFVSALEKPKFPRRKKRDRNPSRTSAKQGSPPKKLPRTGGGQTRGGPMASFHVHEKYLLEPAGSYVGRPRLPGFLRWPPPMLGRPQYLAIIRTSSQAPSLPRSPTSLRTKSPSPLFGSQTLARPRSVSMTL
ncbi:hypothetical protein GQ53DRAFT_386211 [Thozetella sp. PMI_491]|nr:hypothetical protein GQ53DRAFT_386211 [Thozetella sp. PMI_491]